MEGKFQKVDLVSEQQKALMVCGHEWKNILIKVETMCLN